MQFDPARILQKLSATYWFVPSCMVFLAIALSFLMPWLDTRYEIDPSSSFGWIGQTQTDGARAVLVAIAGSIIGVTGTTFSITIVAVSFASANFGPRLIANFMRDRGNQITLGTFISTFVYCLLVLRRVHNAASDGGSASFDAFVPHLSVIVALLLALASVGVLIYFIHHVPEMINIDRLVAQIGHKLKRSVAGLFPDSEALSGGASPDSWAERARERSRVPVPARQAGYVQGTNLQRLAELADEHDVLLRVPFRPGDFVVEGDTLLEVLGMRAPPGGARHHQASDDSLAGKLRDCFEMSYQRSEHQDCLFLAAQLVEVIGRAMSPGINDPFTAITCLHWLKGALIEFVERDARSGGPNRIASVRVHPIDFEQLVNAVFDQTRQYVCADRDVALHAMTILAEIGARTTRADHRATLRKRMTELCAASQAALAPAVGSEDVERRYQEALQLLDDPDARTHRLDDTGWFGGSG